VNRLVPPSDLVDSVVHFWIPEWKLPRGQASRQMVLTYPVVNVVVEPGAAEGDVTVHGPHTAMSYRVLSGKGWAVGALLRPAAVPAVLALACPPTTGARTLVDSCLALEEPELLCAVVAAMRSPTAQRLERTVAVFADWLRARLKAAGAPDRDGLLANALVDLIDAVPAARVDHPADDLPRRVIEVARRLGTSTRTLQRVSLAYTGFTPAALIRRRRLQDAADRLRRDPNLDLTRLAQDVGYADHAHLTRDFRAVLGFTPSVYRDAVAFSD
jgi:AraC-like DNA-binding protein